MIKDGDTGSASTGFMRGDTMVGNGDMMSPSSKSVPESSGGGDTSFGIATPSGLAPPITMESEATGLVRDNRPISFSRSDTGKSGGRQSYIMAPARFGISGIYSTPTDSSQTRVVCPPDVVHTVLWRALPHGAPGHRAPPQLAQIQMICSHMSVHITHNPFSTVGTIPPAGNYGIVSWPPHASYASPAGATLYSRAPSLHQVG